MSRDVTPQPRDAVPKVKGGEPATTPSPAAGWIAETARQEGAQGRRDRTPAGPSDGAIDASDPKLRP